MKITQNLLLLVCLILAWACKEDSFQDDDALPKETFPMVKIGLDNLDEYKETGSNWQIAGDVYADRNKEKSLEAKSGKGILVNLPTEKARENLFTNFEHEDIDLELEVLMPKGSNSGIYLMSRYEVRLFDSWGKEMTKHSDMGGLYERWDETRSEDEKGYEGKAPLINAAKAPGLWQHLRIIFQAPRFDANGNKVKNAIFKEVYLNNTLVQQNQEVSGPTRAAAFEDEVPIAPIMLQGDHGPVAFRNIQYKKYKASKVEITDLKLSVFASNDDTIGVKLDTIPEAAMQVDSMSYLQAGKRQGYLLTYEGALKIPLSGEYIFTTQIDGGAFLILAGDTIINQNYYHPFAEKFVVSKKLGAGVIPFKFIYNKPSRGWRRGMAIFVEGEEIARQPLHAPSSIYEDKPDEPILVTVNNEVITQRSFMMHQGKKRTHVISIGSPNEVHYAYALETGTLLQAWHGGFLDATLMWHERGEPQLAVPLGPELEFHAGPTLAFLANETTPWPDSIQSEVKYKPMGYTIDENGYPMFSIKIDEVFLSDKVLPEAGLHKLSRQLQVSGSKNNTYLKLASGSKIELLADGAYAIDDKKFYLTVKSNENGEVMIRDVTELQELLFKPAGNEATINYEIIW